jgi:hypothetical protein
VPKTRFNHNWTDFARMIGYNDERHMLEEMYITQGLSLSEMSSRLECGVHTVNRHLNVLNITKRSRGGCNGTASQSRKLFLLDQRVVIHAPLVALAKSIGISTSLIYRYRRFITRKPEEEVWSSASSVPSLDSNATPL